MECATSTAIGSATTLLQCCDRSTAIIGISVIGAFYAANMFFDVWKTKLEYERYKDEY